jgi:hypothetical protein
MRNGVRAGRKQLATSFRHRSVHRVQACGKSSHRPACKDWWMRAVVVDDPIRRRFQTLSASTRFRGGHLQGCSIRQQEQQRPVVAAGFESSTALSPISAPRVAGLIRGARASSADGRAAAGQVAELDAQLDPKLCSVSACLRCDASGPHPRRLQRPSTIRACANCRVPQAAVPHRIRLTSH